MPVPLVSPGEVWTFETGVRLREHLAVEPSVVVSWCASWGSAQDRARQARNVLDLDKYRVTVEGTTVIAHHRDHYAMVKLGIPGHSERLAREWVTAAEAAQILGHSRHSVSKHGLVRVQVHKTEMYMYSRADVERLARQRAESKRRKRVADALRGKTR
jgi:hypothetical protein